jgi:hypothetical protein
VLCICSAARPCAHRRCSNVRIRFQQREAGEGGWDAVEAGQSVAYAWDEPMMPRRLRVMMESALFGDGAVHEYKLDEIRVRLPVC